MLPVASMNDMFPPCDSRSRTGGARYRDMTMVLVSMSSRSAAHCNCSETLGMSRPTSSLFASTRNRTCSPEAR